MFNLNHLLADESGQDLIEYALIASLLALGAVASLRTMSASIVSILNSVGTNLTNAT
jgi:pilus assembly protein Flp/PilA